MVEAFDWQAEGSGWKAVSSINFLTIADRKQTVNALDNAQSSDDINVIIMSLAVAFIILSIREFICLRRRISCHLYSEASWEICEGAAFDNSICVAGTVHDTRAAQPQRPTQRWTSWLCRVGRYAVADAPNLHNKHHTDQWFHWQDQRSEYKYFCASSHTATTKSTQL